MDWVNSQIIVVYIYVYNYKCLLLIIPIHLYSANTMKYSKTLYIGKGTNKLKQRSIKSIKCAKKYNI